MDRAEVGVSYPPTKILTLLPYWDFCCFRCPPKRFNGTVQSNLIRISRLCVLFFYKIFIENYQIKIYKIHFLKDIHFYCTVDFCAECNQLIVHWEVIVWLIVLSWLPKLSNTWPFLELYYHSLFNWTAMENQVSNTWFYLLPIWVPFLIS